MTPILSFGGFAGANRVPLQTECMFFLVNVVVVVGSRTVSSSWRIRSVWRLDESKFYFYSSRVEQHIHLFFFWQFCFLVNNLGPTVLFSFVDNLWISNILFIVNVKIIIIIIIITR